MVWPIESRVTGAPLISATRVAFLIASRKCPIQSSAHWDHIPRAAGRREAPKVHSMIPIRVRAVCENPPLPVRTCADGDVSLSVITAGAVSVQLFALGTVRAHGNAILEVSDLASTDRL